MNPDALYYGGVAQAGVKVVKQSYDIMPKVIRAGGDGVYGAEILKGAGFPAAEGLYATIAAPNILDNPDAKPFVEAFAKKYGQQPENYSITAYDAALVIMDAVKDRKSTRLNSSHQIISYAVFCLKKKKKKKNTQSMT